MNVAWVCLFPFYFIMVEGGWGKGCWAALYLGLPLLPCTRGVCVTMFSGLSQVFTPTDIPILPCGLGPIDRNASGSV